MKRALVAMGALAIAVASSCATPEVTEFSPELFGRAQGIASGADPTSLELHVRAIYDVRQTDDAPVSTVRERAPLSRASVVDYLGLELAKAGLQPRIEGSESSVGPVTNVVADIPGRTSELVLLTAHLDAWHRAGADDDASGLAVLLEAARVLRPTNPLRTIRLVAFDREEEGLFGSIAYRQAHAGDSVRIVVNVDAVGFTSKTQDHPPGFDIPDEGDFLAVLANGPAKRDLGGAVKLASKLANVPELVGIVVPGDGRYAGTRELLRSDHAVFWLDDERALAFTDTADFRNSHYHTPGDTPDTLDYAFLGGVARTILATTLAFAEVP